MTYVRFSSWGMTLLGLACIAATAVLNLDLMWLLTGILLAFAGIVKLTIMLIWTRLAHFESDRHIPEKSV
jgi:hypothetical protein